MGPALPPASAAKAAMAVEGLCLRRRFARKVLKLRFMERAVRESLARACLAGLRRWLVRRTVMIGATLAMVSMPKPCGSSSSSSSSSCTGQFGFELQQLPELTRAW